MENLSKLNKNGTSDAIETYFFQIRSPEKWLLDFNHSNHPVKTEFLQRSQAYDCTSYFALAPCNVMLK